MYIDVVVSKIAAGFRSERTWSCVQRVGSAYSRHLNLFLSLTPQWGSIHTSNIFHQSVYILYILSCASVPN